MSIKNITVLGAGLMGCGIAQVFAQDDNMKVMLRDIITKEKPLFQIQENLNLMIEGGAMTEEKAEKIVSRISFTTDLEKAVRDADLVIECVPEIMVTKQNLFRDIEPLCKQSCILATNTSVMSITEIASKSKNKGRIIGTHFWNPAYLIPLVEITKGEETEEETMTLTYDCLKKIGKKPVKCQKDVPGFIANRLQHAIWREAFSIVEKGIADAATVDEALRYGPGLRWPILGILENADMVGLDLSLHIQNYIAKHLEDSHEPSKML